MDISDRLYREMKDEGKKNDMLSIYFRPCNKCDNVGDFDYNCFSSNSNVCEYCCQCTRCWKFGKDRYFDQNISDNRIYWKENKK